jgi:hypothetical protein
MKPVLFTEIRNDYDVTHLLFDAETGEYIPCDEIVVDFEMIHDLCAIEPEECREVVTSMIELLSSLDPAPTFVPDVVQELRDILDEIDSILQEKSIES